jgi:hypothetical protein
VERIERAIVLIREHKAMLDSDLASLYSVQTKALVRAVKRHANRSPPDFMFQLNQELRLRPSSPAPPGRIPAGCGWSGVQYCVPGRVARGTAVLGREHRSTLASSVVAGLRFRGTRFWF